ncbi:MAG TPA: hypothetical protein VGS20_08595 [Candidatus Acidoferrales bacterium]|nr:hypothetical protein [Candidatus Acidoferrales bacterium]
MDNDNTQLYDLLPAIYRERDAQNNYPLRDLLDILARQGALVDRDIQQLYENLFIETCADWVVPYIGDLVSNNLLYDASRIPYVDTAKSLFPDLAGRDLLPPVAVRVRADVAKTIYYRRRKATPRMLEELAADVTGWSAHVVEFFQLLGWTQHLEHLRYPCQWTDLRSLDRLERLYGAFDETSHTVDVRHPAQQTGWHNIRNVGIFLWRLGAFPLENVSARQAGQPWQYHFSPLGNPAPLFTRQRREPDDGSLAIELNVPAPIRRPLFYADLQAYLALQLPRPGFTELYGPFGPLAGNPDYVPDTSLYVVLNGAPVDPSMIVCQRLDPWPAAQPPGQVIWVDAVSGRMAVGAGWPAAGPVDVFFHYGFSAGLGGGPYDREKWLVRQDWSPVPPPIRYQVQQKGVAPVFTKLIDAINQWQNDGRPNAVISILDSRNYPLPGSIALRNEGWLVIEAASGQRPLLQTSAAGLALDVSPPSPITNPDRNGSLTLSGVVVEGFLHVIGDLGQLRFLHSTLVPGRNFNTSTDGSPAHAGSSLIVDQGPANQPINEQLEVQAAFSILGSLVIPQTAAGIWLLDCILDGAGAAALADYAGAHSGPLHAERSTLFGTAQAKSLDASEVIFTAKIDVLRKQDGCVRFSYVVPGSRTPRRFRCQPDLAIDEAIALAEQTNPNLTQAQKDEITHFVQAWLSPSFSSNLYGQPAYAQLRLACPVEIRTGAEDGSEMGAFSHLKQPQRESNLRIRLQEYLPFGLDAGILYVPQEEL